VHMGGGVQKAQEKLTGRSPCFSGAVGGATALEKNVFSTMDGHATNLIHKIM
jgi:hypothetical protein